MQAFGKFLTSFDVEYVVEEYIYIPQEDEVITIAELKSKLENKRKMVIGTIFLYNPTIAPVGYNTNTKLASQGYNFDGEFCELNFDNNCNLFSSAIKSGYRGKLIEIKYLFGLNRPNIEPTSVLEEFDADLDKYASDQLTRYDKELNYQDYLNIRLSGKFVFFASGNKFDRHHKHIITYVRNLSAQASKLGKTVAFMHDNNYDAQESAEGGYFLPAIATGKFRDTRANAFKKAFSTFPPSIVKTS
ncbi:hypothetical protein Suden_0992 [Sulfurimonas denitrificans DSM 1251]|uniref:Uncharacterized protein n=1 Tax=Sulfurimonas denitrificans (strain ATCC 33889 / DSM 1251) TaxID=326298 RepID=Q30RW1_SULDN|nr:hypothetical protein [Sulfurimonas denitrificans]ABB44270.1 hypothetical protein Suden_0992 [Sulfurimonas denitrificans DSM 1251]MDD3443104.1 hypothetical protein [Sulfurimonas denitrificans]